jgi:hypothetical protein
MRPVKTCAELGVAHASTASSTAAGNIQIHLLLISIVLIAPIPPQNNIGALHKKAGGIICKKPEF